MHIHIVNDMRLLRRFAPVFLLVCSLLFAFYKIASKRLSVMQTAKDGIHEKLPFTKEKEKGKQQKSHFVKAEELEVARLLFSRDEKSVCSLIETPDPMDSDGYDCWDKTTTKSLSVSRLNQVAEYSPPEKHGSLSIRYRIEGGVVYYDGSGCSASKNCSNAEIGYSSDGKRLTLAEENAVSQWDRRTGRRLSKIPLKQLIDETCYQKITSLSPDGTVCAVRHICGNQERYELLDCQNGEVVGQTYPRIFSVLSESFFTSDSQTFVVWTREQAQFYDARTANLLWTLNLNFQDIGTAFYVTPPPLSGGLVGIPVTDGFNLYDAHTGNIVRQLDFPTLSDMATWNFPPDGKQLWWATPDNKIFWRQLD